MRAGWLAVGSTRSRTRSTTRSTTFSRSTTCTPAASTASRLPTGAHQCRSCRSRSGRSAGETGTQASSPVCLAAGALNGSSVAAQSCATSAMRRRSIGCRPAHASAVPTHRITVLGPSGAWSRGAGVHEDLPRQGVANLGLDLARQPDEHDAWHGPSPLCSTHREPQQAGGPEHGHHGQEPDLRESLSRPRGVRVWATGAVPMPHVADYDRRRQREGGERCQRVVITPSCPGDSAPRTRLWAPRAGSRQAAVRARRGGLEPTHTRRPRPCQRRASRRAAHP
jgi:hypothetical protein